jgi:hypothetical protein
VRRFALVLDVPMVLCSLVRSSCSGTRTQHLEIGILIEMDKQDISRLQHVFTSCCSLVTIVRLRETYDAGYIIRGSGGGVTDRRQGDS